MNYASNIPFDKKVQGDDYNLRWPLDDVDIKKKSTPQYAKACAEAIYATSILQRGYNSNYDRRDDYIENRLYGEGRQSTTKYMDWLTKVNDQGLRVGYVNYDWSIRSVIPRYRDVTLRYLMLLDFDVVVNAIDEHANDERSKKKYTMWAETAMKSKLKEIEQMGGIQLTTPRSDFLPESLEELELYIENMGLKLPDEMSFEEAIQINMYLNDFTVIKRRVYEDLFDLGIACTKTYTDSLGRVRVRYVDMVNVIYLGKVNRMSTEDMKAIGELRKISIGELKELAGDQFSEEDYVEIANQTAGLYGNGNDTFEYRGDQVNTDDIYGCPWDTYHVLVFDVQWNTDDPVTKYKRNHDNGYSYHQKPRNYKPPKKADKRDEVRVTHINTKYEAMWIVGTDFVFNHGKVRDIVDSTKDLKKTEFDYTLHQIATNSHTERMVPVADSIQLTELKIGALKAKAKPKGISVNVRALRSITLGGTTLTTKEVLQLYHDTGDVLYDEDPQYESDLSNPYIQSGSRPSPIQELEGGMGPAFQELLQSREMDIAFLEKLTGLNDIFAAGTPAERQGLGVAEIAQQQASNSIGALIEGGQYIFEKTCQKIGGKLQLIAKFGGIEKYKHAIGESTVKMIETNTDWSARHMGIMIKWLPTAEEKNMLIQGAMEQLNVRSQTGQGGITYPDFLFIVDKIQEGRIKAARALLDFKIQKQKAQDLKEQQMLSEQNAQNNAQAGIAVEQEKEKAEFRKHTQEMISERNKTFLKMLEETQKARMEAINNALKDNAEKTPGVETDLLKIRESFDQATANILSQMSGLGAEPQPANQQQQQPVPMQV